MPAESYTPDPAHHPADASGLVKLVREAIPVPTYDCCGGQRHTDDCPTGRDPRTEES